MSHKAHLKKWIHHCRSWVDCSESEINESSQKDGVYLQEEHYRRGRLVRASELEKVFNVQLFCATDVSCFLEAVN